MKRWLSLIFFAEILCCFAACGPADTPQQPEGPEGGPAVTASEDTIVTFFNVGAVPQVNDSASCCIIEDSGKLTVIDAGMNVSATEEKIVQFLRKKGYSKIDYLILTHAHLDHCGGMTYLIERFDVGAFYYKTCADYTKTNYPNAEKYYNEIITLLQAKTNEDGTKPVLNESRQEITEIEVSPSSSFTIYYNQAVYNGDSSFATADGKIDYNYYSFGVKYESKHTSVYFGGDAPDALDDVLLGQVGKCQIMAAPHHGTSGPYSSQALLNEIKPEYTVVQGLNRNFGADTKARYEAIGTKIYTNEDYGTVIFTAKDGQISVKTEKTPN